MQSLEDAIRDGNLIIENADVIAKLEKKYGSLVKDNPQFMSLCEGLAASIAHANMFRDAGLTGGVKLVTMTIAKHAEGIFMLGVDCGIKQARLELFKEAEDGEA